MYASEKLGGCAPPQNLLDGFSNTVEQCGLQDLGFSGNMFTWERCRGTNQWIQERLGRGLANIEWKRLFPDAKIQVIDVSTSDHLPIFLQLNRKIYVPKSRRFRFENLWIREKDCVDIFAASWNEVLDADIVWKISNCGKRLEE